MKKPTEDIALLHICLEAEPKENVLHYIEFLEELVDLYETTMYQQADVIADMTDQL